jgi:hypothetical protein
MSGFRSAIDDLASSMKVLKLTEDEIDDFQVDETVTLANPHIIKQWNIDWQSALPAAAAQVTINIMFGSIAAYSYLTGPLNVASVGWFKYRSGGWTTIQSVVGDLSSTGAFQASRCLTESSAQFLLQQSVDTKIAFMAYGGGVAGSVMDFKAVSGFLALVKSPSLYDLSEI